MFTGNTRSHGAVARRDLFRPLAEILRQKRREGLQWELAAAQFNGSATPVTVKRTSSEHFSALSWASGCSGECDVESLDVAKQGALRDSKLSRGRTAVEAVAFERGAESSETEGARSFDAQEVTDERHGASELSARELEAITDQLDAIECDERYRALRAVRRARARAQELAHALAQLVLPCVELDAAACDHPREGGAR